VGVAIHKAYDPFDLWIAALLLVARNDGVRKGSGYLVFCLRVAAAKLALPKAGETYGSRVMVFLDAYSLFIQQSHPQGGLLLAMTEVGVPRCIFC
jgi:hypothetical protein